MEKSSLIVLQTSALSRINFAYYELMKNPPLNLVLDSVGNTDEEKIINYVSSLTSIELDNFNKDMFNYFKNETTTQSRMMLITNYLYALLVKSKNNKISIHNNFESRKEEIEKFLEVNKETIDKLTTIRNKIYSHIDLDWLKVAKNISFEEIRICIAFLNSMLDYDFDNILSNVEGVNIYDR